MRGRPTVRRMTIRCQFSYSGRHRLGDSDAPRDSFVATLNRCESDAEVHAQRQVELSEEVRRFALTEEKPNYLAFAGDVNRGEGVCDEGVCLAAETLQVGNIAIHEVGTAS